MISLSCMSIILVGCCDGAGDVKSSLKGRARAVEKAQLDYHGDGARVTDLLRGCVICINSIAEVRAAYAHLLRLERDGVITIVQNKNRYIDGPTITGYLDANGTSRL